MLALGSSTDATDCTVVRALVDRLPGSFASTDPHSKPTPDTVSLLPKNLHSSTSIDLRAFQTSSREPQ